jgi:hypothetical protein
MVKKQPNPYLGASSGEELAPTQRLAHDIVALRRDLIPSVERIMNADLGEATIDALGLFQRALTDLADPNRDPAVAIEAARNGRQIVLS